MAIINKTGIGEGNLIEAEHITRIIDALTSVSTDTVSATGSFTGSFVGNGSGLTGIVSSTATSASYAATASFLTGTIESASFASTAESASFASTASFVNRLVQDVVITGSLNVTGSSTFNGRVRFGADYIESIQSNSSGGTISISPNTSVYLSTINFSAGENQIAILPDGTNGKVIKIRHIGSIYNCILSSSFGISVGAAASATSSLLNPDDKLTLVYFSGEWYDI
jgi:hypothetical protein